MLSTRSNNQVKSEYLLKLSGSTHFADVACRVVENIPNPVSGVRAPIGLLGKLFTSLKITFL